MKKLLIISACLLVLVGCAKKPEPTPVEPDTSEFTKVPESTMIATITTSEGVIKAELYQNLAPETVNSFASLANNGFYDGLIFHRVIEGFMIQGGDPTGTGMGGPGYQIKGEFNANGFNNNLKHDRGVLSMARAPGMDTAGSQFFIMHQNSPHLDGQYAAFGMVIEGMDVVDKIASTTTGNNDKPETDMVIESITVDTNGLDISDFTKTK